MLPETSKTCIQRCSWMRRTRSQRPRAKTQQMQQQQQLMQALQLLMTMTSCNGVRRGQCGCMVALM